MKADKSKTIFDLGLVQDNRVANIIFILGVAVAFIGLDQEEQSIKQTATEQFSNESSPNFAYSSGKSLALANWIYFVAGIILLNTSSASLEEKIATKPIEFSLSSEKNINGTKKVVVGNILRTIGYAVAAIGWETIADSAK